MHVHVHVAVTVTCIGGRHKSSKVPAARSSAVHILYGVIMSQVWASVLISLRWSVSVTPPRVPLACSAVETHFAYITVLEDTRAVHVNYNIFPLINYTPGARVLLFCSKITYQISVHCFRL